VRARRLRVGAARAPARARLGLFDVNRATSSRPPTLITITLRSSRLRVRALALHLCVAHRTHQATSPRADGDRSRSGEMWLPAVTKRVRRRGCASLRRLPTTTRAGASHGVRGHTPARVGLAVAETHTPGV
jgi:hypothetical protein